MLPSNKNNHLTLEERIIIEKGIANQATKKSIASTIGKDNSTIGKEINLHREQRYHTTLQKDCAIYAKCKNNRQCINCSDFIPFYCNRRDRSPGACNGCSYYRSCRHNKYFYSAEIAQREYEKTLVETRVGINITAEELKKKADIIVPLIKQGHSPYHIITCHPELGMSEKTLYNYIEEGVFRNFGLLDIDLRIKTKRKMPKSKSNQYKPRKDRRYLIGRKHNDYLAYMEDNTNSCVVQGDTVYNNITEGPFLQTFKFMDYGFIFILFHETKTSEEMVKGFNLLEEILGKELFKVEVEVHLLDRGSEFLDADGFERAEDGTKRTHVFYCDPMASGQKGSLENKHREIRYICPKEKDLRTLGLTSQDKVNLMTSHVNSAPIKSLKGKSPIEVMKFLNPELFKRFEAFGIREIPSDEVNLTPSLLK